MSQQEAFVALRRMKVHSADEHGELLFDDDGRPVLRVCMPGDPIPEAGSWRNLLREIIGNRVGVAGSALTGATLAASVNRAQTGPARPTPATVAAGKAAEKSKAEAASAAKPAKPGDDKRRRRRRRSAADVAVENATGAESEGSEVDIEQAEVSSTDEG